MIFTPIGKPMGVEAIKEMCAKNPAEYVKVVASILPRDLNVKVSAVESMTDEELNATIRRLLVDFEEREGSEPTEH